MFLKKFQREDVILDEDVEKENQKLKHDIEQLKDIINNSY